MANTRYIIGTVSDGDLLESAQSSSAMDAKNFHGLPQHLFFRRMITIVTWKTWKQLCFSHFAGEIPKFIQASK